MWKARGKNEARQADDDLDECRHGFHNWREVPTVKVRLNDSHKHCHEWQTYRNDNRQSWCRVRMIRIAVEAGRSSWGHVVIVGRKRRSMHVSDETFTWKQKYTNTRLHCFEPTMVPIIQKMEETAWNGMRSGLAKFATVEEPIVCHHHAREAVEHTERNRENQQITLMTNNSREEMNENVTDSVMIG